MIERSYLVNVNEGKDTIHRAIGLTEQCNTDDALGLKTVDEMTAEALFVRGDAVLCQHCKPEFD